MNQAINQELTLFRDFLDRENELGILIGSHQNLDTYAAALSLYLSLTQAGKKVQIVSKKAPTVEVSNLVGIDRVKDAFAGSTSKLVVALPYIKGEVEKVLFTEAPNTINFHLTAAPDRSITPFDLSDVKLIWEGGAPQAIIAVGVGTIDEIGQVADPNATKIVNIDNYQGNTRFGDVVLVDDNFSSLSEITAKVIKDLTLPMDVDIAQNTLDGVLYATRNFTKGNTSPLAFEAASSAMYQGAQRKGEEQPRREQQLGGQRNPSQQNDRRGREQRNQPQPRVADSDFPAMHMQGQPRVQDQARDNRRPDVPRMPQPQRGGQFAQTQRNVADIRNKLMQHQNQQQFEQPAEEDQPMVPSPMAQPVEDVQMPPQQSYSQQNNEDIPDDWLMPKVFKSSKNNN